VLFRRDDLIFLIYLYQRYIYRVDMTRVNEFGFSGQQQAEVDAAKAAAEAANGAATSDAVPALEVRGRACSAWAVEWSAHLDVWTVLLASSSNCCDSWSGRTYTLKVW
jgi:hypothetical protein